MEEIVNKEDQKTVYHKSLTSYIRDS